jgi:hydroxylaminobenzene mutase
MNASDIVARQGHRMLQIGVALFVFSGLEGFVIPALPVPRLGLSVHTLSALQGVITLVLGLVWPKLTLGPAASRTAFWTFLYSSFATLIPFVMAAVWGAGNSTIPLAAGPAHGTVIQEAAIRVVLYSAAAPFFVSMGLVLWGSALMIARHSVSSVRSSCGYSHHGAPRTLVALGAPRQPGAELLAIQKL